MRRWACMTLVLLCAALPPHGRADLTPLSPPSERGASSPAPRGVEELARVAGKSVVLIRVEGRDATRQGLGSGFVLDSSGLIATNLHVIGEGRGITVTLPDGRTMDVTQVYAADRGMDLAIVRVPGPLPAPLPLSDGRDVIVGQPVFAIGNPEGLAGSVVSGVISARREIDGRQMLQVAIPVEMGNSGGPLLDMRGRVIGLITMRDAVTPNLGFAEPVEGLIKLMSSPNPVPIDRWRTIGVLAPERWRPLQGARWRQRAGHITVERPGTGLGGKSLCLWQGPVPDGEMALSVQVRLDDENGAAGLVFGVRDQDHQWGFYATAGHLRLTRFDGPDLSQWRILAQEDSPHYRPQDFNRLTVRIERDRIVCLVNDHAVFESREKPAAGGQVGLIKFRDTRALFKEFLVAREVPSHAPSPEDRRRIEALLAGIPTTGPPDAALLDSLTAEIQRNMDALADRLHEDERRLAAWQSAIARAQKTLILRQLHDALFPTSGPPGLLRAVLLVEKLDNPELDIDTYVQQVDEMARVLGQRTPAPTGEDGRFALLLRYLFTERGFHGSHSEYFTLANSHMSEVMDDREGLPIMLSILTMELAARLGLEVQGIGLPGHFCVRFVPTHGPGRMVDPFEGGRTLTEADLSHLITAHTGRDPTAADLAPVDTRAIVLRVLRNLVTVASAQDRAQECLGYLDAVLMLEPDSAPDRWHRLQLRLDARMRREALEDIDWLEHHHATPLEAQRLLELRQALTATAR